MLAGTTGGLMAVSLLAGTTAVTPQDAVVAARLGKTLLFVVGTCQIYQGWRHYLLTSARQSGEEPGAALRLGPFRTLLQVLGDPARADFNVSGRLEAGEAALLSLALALDALAAGLGLGLLRFPLTVVLPVAVACPLFVAAGAAAGRRFGGNWLSHRVFMVAGALTCTVAILAHQV